MSIKYLIPVRTPSAANLREHWGARARRAKKQRRAGLLVTRGHLVDIRRMQRPLTITLMRCASRALDGDNLQAALKNVRDGIAEAIGIDDGDEQAAVWQYRQTSRIQFQGESVDGVAVDVSPAVLAPQEA